MPRNTPAKRRSAPPTLAKSAEPNPASIAARIRSIRQRKGVTLEQLAAQCALDRGYLSRIERGHKTPSIATLLKIGEALGVQMAHLFGEAVGPDAITVVRHTEYKPFPGPSNGKEHALTMVLPQSAARRLSLVMVSPGAAPTLGSADHSGEEMIFVLEGEVEVSFADRKVALSEGDCVHFDGHLKHGVRRLGTGRARALIVVGQDLAKGVRAP